MPAWGLRLSPRLLDGPARYDGHSSGTSALLPQSRQRSLKAQCQGGGRHRGWPGAQQHVWNKPQGANGSNR